MKRLDEFELFHQRRKRRPLGEIPVAENAPPRSSGGKNTPFGLRPEDPAKKSRNIHNTGNNRVPGSSGSRNDTEFRFSWSDKHGNKENIIPPGYKDKSPKTLDNGRAPPLFGQTGQFLKNRQFSTPKHCISQKDKCSGEMAASSAISITQIRQLASKTKQGETVPPKTEMATCSPNPIPLSMLTSKLWSDSPLPKTPSARYSLLQSLVDYNCTVENSNKEIRTFYDSMRLREPAPVSGGPPERSKKGSISIGDPTSHHPVIVVRSTQISPLMTAATTSPQGEILLMHTYETQIGAGSKVILDEFFVYQVAGTPMKAYYNWRLV
ncbi:hypothetical protein JCM33374_g1864 [Metschnikowia sp. JCM 33374]|nr:hypothetical protein JCM33374_g1864 [Metschnikowia sp. JCM 33374]